MALDRWLGPLFDIARSLTQEPPRPAPSARPAVAPWRPAALAETEAPAAVASDAATESAAEPAALAEPEVAWADASATEDPIDDAELTEPADAGDAGDAGDGDDDGPVATPLVSRSMARLLAAQGHGRRAASMYEALLRERPDDDALRAEYETARTATRKPRPSRRSLDEGLAGEDEIVAVRASTSDLLLSWQVGEGRIARGRKLMPEADGVAVRVVVFRRSPDFRVEREERERAVEVAGEWLVRDVPADAWVTASVGLRKDDRFVSLAHSAAARAS